MKVTLDHGQRRFKLVQKRPLLLKQDEAQPEQAWRREVRVSGGLRNTTNMEGRHDTNTPLNTPEAFLHTVSGRCIRSNTLFP